MLSAMIYGGLFEGLCDVTDESSIFSNHILVLHFLAVHVFMVAKVYSLNSLAAIVRDVFLYSELSLDWWVPSDSTSE